MNFIFLKVLIPESWCFTGWNSSRDDIRKNKIEYFKTIHNGSSNMQKKLLAEIFCIFECLLVFPPNPSNQSSQLSWFFQTKWKTITKLKKTGGFRELIVPGNNLKICTAVNFPKRTFRFFRPGNQPRLEFFFTCPSTYKLNIK